MLALIKHAILATALVAGSAMAADLPLATIATLDTTRYVGTWYEIARYPNFFQRKCRSNTVANYTAQADGSIRVDNRCVQENGRVEQALGAARQPGGPGSPKLEVRFAPAWLSWLPLAWANYWVIDLDPGYTLAAVSEPNRKYLWILARTPKVEPRAYAALLQRLAAQGFDTAQLIPTRQEQ